MTNEQLVALASEDLVQVFGNEAGAPVHAVVIREKRATFSCAPRRRSPASGPGDTDSNMFLAGDWTATGLPATIEGAVISGETMRGVGSAARRLILKRAVAFQASIQHITACCQKKSYCLSMMNRRS